MTIKVKSRQIAQMSLALAVVLGVGYATSQPTVAATLYSVIELGNPDISNGLTVTGINNLGQVVGSWRNIIPTPPYSVQRGFRTAPNSSINPATDILGTSLANLSSGLYNLAPTAINDLGQVVGNINGRFFRAEPNGLADAPLSDYRVNSGNNINNLGQVAVAANFQGLGDYASYRTAPNSSVNGQTDSVGNLGGGFSSGGFIIPSVIARAINDLGQVVGNSQNTSGESHAFRTAPNSRINPATDDLGTLGGSRSDAFDINNLGQVVGTSTTASGETHAFRTAPNSPINPAIDDLGTLGGSRSSARAINILGQVVGTSTTASGEERAFLYDNNQMLDLNDLIPADLGVILNYAADINDQGQIAAGSFGPSFRQNRIFLLTPIVSTPIPEPSSALGTLAIGVIGVGSMVWRKRQIAALANLRQNNIVKTHPFGEKLPLR